MLDNSGMKISEIEIDDSQTGYYWIQIYVKNKKEAVSLRHQIFDDQAIRERLKNEISRSEGIVSKSSNKIEITLQNFLIHKLSEILEGPKS